MTFDIFTVFSVALLWLAIGLNTAVAVRNYRSRKRELARHHEQFARLVAFAALMSEEASGAPVGVRQMAKDALPPGTEVTFHVEPPPSHGVH